MFKRSGLARSLVEEFGRRGGETEMSKWSIGVFRVIKLSIQYYLSKLIEPHHTKREP